MKKKIFFITEFILIVLLLLLYQYNKYTDNNLEKYYKTNKIKDIAKVANNNEIIKSFQEKYNNLDIKGILKIKNEDYEIPVLQTDNNEYYLTHLPNKSKNAVGSVFLDYRNDIDNSKKNLIYGHNSRTLKTPFTILEKFYDKEYFYNHDEAYLITENQTRTYKLFSLYVELTDFSYIKLDLTDKEYASQLNDFKSKSWFDVDIKLNSDTNILLLQTCSKRDNYLKYDKKFLILAFAEI